MGDCSLPSASSRVTIERSQRAASAGFTALSSTKFADVSRALTGTPKRENNSALSFLDKGPTFEPFIDFLQKRRTHQEVTLTFRLQRKGTSVEQHYEEMMWEINYVVKVNMSAFRVCFASRIPEIVQLYGVPSVRQYQLGNAFKDVPLMSHHVASN